MFESGDKIDFTQTSQIKKILTKQFYIKKSMSEINILVVTETIISEDKKIPNLLDSKMFEKDPVFNFD